MERLSGDDTRILRLESDAIAGHTLKLVVVEPGPAGQTVSVEGLQARIEARLGGLPRARQRLAPTPLRIATPAWVDDGSFDIRNHVRLASEPIEDRAALHRFVGKVMAERLDHSRPLWCVDVAGPDPDGRTAIVIRVHHCLADGVTALRMLSRLLWDAQARSELRLTPALDPEPAPGRARLLASGAASRLRATGGAPRGRRPHGGLAAALARGGARPGCAAGNASPRALAPGG